MQTYILNFLLCYGSYNISFSISERRDCKTTDTEKIANAKLWPLEYKDRTVGIEIMPVYMDRDWYNPLCYDSIHDIKVACMHYL